MSTALRLFGLIILLNVIRYLVAAPIEQFTVMPGLLDAMEANRLVFQHELFDVRLGDRLPVQRPDVGSDRARLPRDASAARRGLADEEPEVIQADVPVLPQRQRRAHLAEWQQSPRCLRPFHSAGKSCLVIADDLFVRALVEPRQVRDPLLNPNYVLSQTVDLCPPGLAL